MKKLLIKLLEKWKTKMGKLKTCREKNPRRKTNVMKTYCMWIKNYGDVCEENMNEIKSKAKQNIIYCTANYTKSSMNEIKYDGIMMEN